MKTTGIVRKIDRLGRITIPIEIRNALQIHAKDELRLYIVNNGIAAERNTKKCSLCGLQDGVQIIAYRGGYLCHSCIETVKSLENGHFYSTAP